MKRFAWRAATCTALLLASVVTYAAAHDLFLRPDTFFVAPGGTVSVSAFNGSFTASEASVTPDRLIDLSVTGPDGRAQAAITSWKTSGNDTRWTAHVGAAGTYVLGASLKARTIKLAAADFNKYLSEDGIPEVLAARRAAHELTVPGRERYEKHVKALVQVGDAPSSSFGTVLGYPAELVPLDNPYVGSGARTLRVRALVAGKPTPEQVVILGGTDAKGRAIREQSVTTDHDGVARVRVEQAGAYYVKFIRMVRIPASAHDSVDYHSRWATLTFGVR